MAMMQALLKQEKILHVLSQSVRAERRITNLQHLLEVLQQAVIDRRLGLHKTLNWLKTEITNSLTKTKGATKPSNFALRAMPMPSKSLPCTGPKGLNILSFFALICGNSIIAAVEEIRSLSAITPAKTVDLTV